MGPSLPASRALSFARGRESGFRASRLACARLRSREPARSRASPGLAKRYARGMSFAARIVILPLVLGLSACGDDSSATSSGGGSGPGAGGSGPGTGGPGAGAGGPGSGAGGPGSGSGGEASSTGSGDTTSTTTGGGGAPPCTAETLAEAVRVSGVTLDVQASSGRALTAQAGSSSVVAWAGADGQVHITPLDVVDARAGADLTVEGTQVFGVAATETDVAVLVSRSPDFMTFVRMDRSGAELGRADLVGGGDHLVQDVEWFGEDDQGDRAPVPEVL